MKACLLLLVGAILLAGGCSHGGNAVREEPGPHWGAKNCNSVSARIWALIEKGQFADAQALIAEAKAAELVAAPLPTLQRARDFPSQLKDHTLFEVKQMLDRNDFSLATKAQLNGVVKILQNPKRLIQKL